MSNTTRFWKRYIKISFVILAISFSFFLIMSPHVLADDPYKPYLHEAQVPEHPKVKLYGYYSTNLFPGSATYTYPIEVPRGANSLQPTLSISYNNQAVKQRPGVLGAGWSLTQNYFYRDINSTPDNINDDEFKLIFNGASYDLVYNSSDGFYHTKIESFLKIQNLTGGSNTYSEYWLVTSPDGTKFRFGYNGNSELTSNTGRNYALRWSLDQVEDTHGNKIYYSYLEDPNAEDKGMVYLSQILYNNDQKRKVEFTYETSVRPDNRLLYDQGNQLYESRRLSSIRVSANSTSVRKYEFEYADLNPEQSLSSLSKIKFYGSDNTSLLHQISFEYYSTNIGFTNQTTEWMPPALFSDNNQIDGGVRLIDFNNDGLVDFIQGRESTSEKKAWINNNVNNWTDASSTWAPPVYFVDVNNYDTGVRFIDFDNDGFVDILQSTDNRGVKKAWRNNGTGWTDVSGTWAPPIYFVINNLYDGGVQLADFNGDGRVDILQSHNNGGSAKGAYLNTGAGWQNVSLIWIAPTYFIDNNKDTGARVEDVNGDNLPDIVEGSDFASSIRRAWLNNGTGWINYSSTWAPPVAFTTNTRPDNGVRFADLNGDGLVDILEDYSNGTTTARGAWINNGNGWTQNNSWESPEPFTKDGNNIGRRLGDVNGDGLVDIVVAYDTVSTDYYYTWTKNSTIPYMLRRITNEFGGIVSIDYQDSTHFDNTGGDSLSDIGFNVWVVKNVSQNNSMQGAFNAIGNYSYEFFGGKYDYKDLEFRGFNQSNEKRPDNSIVKHYFHQNDALKGKEYRTEVYSSNSPYSRNEYAFNYTNQSGYFRVFLVSQSSYLYDGSSSNPKITNATYSYDSYGNVLERTFLGDVNVSGDEKYERYSYVYNVSAWVVDRLSRYQLFASDNSTKVKDSMYYYDNSGYGVAPTKGDATRIQNWLDTGGSSVTSFSYDSFGNVIKQTDPLGRETTYRYGLRDTTFTYPDRVTNALFHTTDYNYDLGTGNLLWQKQNDITTYFYYDVFGRIVKEVQPFDSYELPTKTYTYSFDGTAPESIKVSQRTSANKTYDVYYFYDGSANFVQLKRHSEGNQQIVKNFFYDGLGRVVSEQNPYFDSFSTNLSTSPATVNSTNYTYDTLGRVTLVRNPDGTNKTINFDHRTITAYDENGHRKAYVLDGHDRIVNVIEYNNDPVIKLNYETDVYNTSYEYDAADNLVKITDALGNVFSFTYDSLGRRIALSDPDLGNWTYTYDLIGNLITQRQQGGGNLVTGDGFYREYDGLNQLIKIRNGSTATSPQIENYTYDPFGQRIKIMRNDSAKTVIYTPFKELMRIKNSTGTYDYTYIYQDGVLVARVNPDGSKYYYHPDHLGSTSLITDANGNVVENTYYSPYGEILSGGKADVKLYTGQMKDFPCQYYYGARYFAPCWGMFVQPDQFTLAYNPQSLNHYTYALNNPYKYVDTSGLIAVQISFFASLNGGLGLIPLGGTISGGLVITHDDSAKWNEGWQFGLYGNVGGGAYTGAAGISYNFVDISITPSAQRVKDIEDVSLSTGASGGEVVTVSGGAGWPISSEKIVDYSKPTYNFAIGPGLKTPPFVSGYSFFTYTKTITLLSSPFNEGKKIRESRIQQNSAADAITQSSVDQATTQINWPQSQSNQQSSQSYSKLSLPFYTSFSRNNNYYTNYCGIRGGTMTISRGC